MPNRTKNFEKMKTSNAHSYTWHEKTTPSFRKNLRVHKAKSYTRWHKSYYITTDKCFKFQTDRGVKTPKTVLTKPEFRKSFWAETTTWSRWIIKISQRLSFFLSFNNEKSFFELLRRGSCILFNWKWNPSNSKQNFPDVFFDCRNQSC